MTRAAPLSLALAALLTAPAAALAQSAHQAHGAAAPSAAAEGHAAANEIMHRDMAIEPTGDPDVDFARGMIPHHQGAIDMAEVILEHGRDPELRALAEAIIAAQQSEIAFLRNWLAENEPQ